MKGHSISLILLRPSFSTAGNSVEDTNSGNGVESETIFTKVKRKDEKKEEEGKEEDEEAKNKVGLG